MHELFRMSSCLVLSPENMSYHGLLDSELYHLRSRGCWLGPRPLPAWWSKDWLREVKQETTVLTHPQCSGVTPFCLKSDVLKKYYFRYFVFFNCVRQEVKSGFCYSFLT